MLINKKTVIILGSSRSDGDTRKIIDAFNLESQFEIVDLNKLSISYYDYDHQNKDDDFIPLMRRVTTNYKHIIFASPVYWYSMSAIMKCFFDRITDLLSIEKEIGRSLRTMQMSVISCSNGNDLNDSFIDPFKLSARYLGMEFKGHLHTWVEDEKIIPEQVLKSLKAFNANS